MADTDFDFVVVGAGFAGLYSLYKLRGMGMRGRVLEAGSGVGGTWFWNRYPGARCDIESLDYQYSFSEELLRDWQWSERYPAQGELLRYLEHVAERFDLYRDISLNTRVISAVLDEDAGVWTITTDTGEALTTRHCIMATGCLSVPKEPEVPGAESFRGAIHHTGRWPHEGVDFTGKRVAVIGTGSSGIQVIPVIAERAAELTVFQRTPNFIAPAWNGPLDPETAREVVAGYAERRRRIRESLSCLHYPANDKSALEVSEEERERELQQRYEAGGLNMVGAFADVMVDPAANEHVAEFLRGKIRERVADPALAEALAPRSFPWGTKRPCVDTNYYETFNRENVTLVDLRSEPLEEIVPSGVRTSERTHEVDMIVFATGFDAMTGALNAIDVRGRDGAVLRDQWAEGPRTYLGIGLAGFPNLFLITGPGSPSVFSNMVVAVEQHVDWIADAIEHLRRSGLRSIEPTPEAQEAWVAHVAEIAGMTLVSKANSWYMGANVPGKPRVFMPYLGGFGAYQQRCEEVAAAGYEGFALA
jgi:cation diffusion facilitator CzcD-associated flavoprotein CzcO